MENTLDTAKALYDKYRELYGTNVDEMKMHKLMYFSQRESLMLYKEPLFDGTFFGWKYGPVLKEVRAEYRKEHPFDNVDGTVSDRTAELLDSVLRRYGRLSSWQLSELSHSELSWKRARSGMRLDERGDNALQLEAMKVDAARELSKRKACAR